MIKMKLSTRSKPYIIPEYSLTGDLLSFLTCNLQYRYQNKGTLPPSMPVQLWFGEFIHGVLEEAFLRWDLNKTSFPWDWKEDIRPIENMIDLKLQVRGLYPPQNHFFTTNIPGREDMEVTEADHKKLASARAEAAINIWGPHLFPLIDSTEELIKGIRDMPNYKENISRSNYYGINGVVDVITLFKKDELKKAVGWAALQYVQPGTIVGVGTGSTAAHFIDALGTMKGQIEGAVSSSDASTEKLKSLGIHVFDLNEVDSLGIYVDGADEINGHMQMIKGGGAALTREKIIASVAEKFICIADASKQVDILGKFPLPVEVIPMARSAVARQLVKLGGRPEYRQGVVTDNGNVILDVHGMEILDPIAMENAINAIPGVVTVGLFANRGADVALIGTPDGVKTIVK